MGPPIRSLAIARARSGAPQWTSRPSQTIPIRNATTLADSESDTLTAMMSFISTFVYASAHCCRRCHSQLHPRLNGRHQAPVARRLDDSNNVINYISNSRASLCASFQHRRHFHNYFVTHLPSSSVHPDPRMRSGPHHKLPRSASTPHTPGPDEASPAAAPDLTRWPATRELTVVRIPLRSAKHHFGAHNSRGQRKYNEDTNQAGTIDLPAFARRVPVSLSRSPSSARNTGEGNVADSKSSGDPQIFYFGVFDGHGGTECSEFLRDELHGYIEEAAVQFALGSSLRRDSQSGSASSSAGGGSADEGQESRQADDRKRRVDIIKGPEEVKWRMNVPKASDEDYLVGENNSMAEPIKSLDPQPVTADVPAAQRLERELLSEYKDTVGGYFRRFKPAHFSITKSSVDSTSEPSTTADSGETPGTDVTIESVLTYAFLRADLDFITAQARKPDPDDPKLAESPVNNDEVLGAPHHVPPNARRHRIGGPTRFKGGSTASVALISTPTPAPFWQPSASSTLLVAHVGDTRALLCETATGLARALTSDHHPSSPAEARRLSRFLGSSVATDSFGEERFSGLANSRAFGDLQSKRVGVSAEPELCRTEMGPAEYSFLVLVSDGVSGSLSDQEIVDIVKEAKTPEQGGRDVVDYATEVSIDGDNATCLVVRLGGWERRSEGGLGSLGTKEIRDIRRTEAQNPRGRRR